MVLLLFDEEKHGDNQIMRYWINNILTRILLITITMETTINGNICIHAYCIYT